MAVVGEFMPLPQFIVSVIWLQIFPHEYRRALAEKAAEEEQAKMQLQRLRRTSLETEYQENEIIPEELLKKEAVSTISLRSAFHMRWCFSNSRFNCQCIPEKLPQHSEVFCLSPGVTLQLRGFHHKCHTVQEHHLQFGIVMLWWFDELSLFY